MITILTSFSQTFIEVVLNVTVESSNWLVVLSSSSYEGLYSLHLKSTVFVVQFSVTRGAFYTEQVHINAAVNWNTLSCLYYCTIFQETILFGSFSGVLESEFLSTDVNMYHPLQ